MSQLKPFPVSQARLLILLNRSLHVFGWNIRLRRAGVVFITVFFALAIGVPSAQAQTWISMVSASTTGTGAGITWNTAVPSDSQVEYGTTANYGSISSIATAKVAAHAITLSGLAAGGTYHFRVRSGDANGVMVISADYTLTLTATPSLVATPANLNFGTIATQQCSAVQMTTLSNGGSSSVTMTTPVLNGANGGDFTFAGLGSCHTPQVLAPGATCTHSLKFCPTTAGSRSAADSIPNNSPTSPMVVSLTGTGSAAASSLAVSPASLSFSGLIGASSPAPAAVSITNAGTGSLTFTAASDQPWLALSSSSGTAPSTLQVSPSITGLKAGAYTGHVNLAGGGDTKTVTVNLSVASSPVDHSVALSWSAQANSHIVSYSVYRSTVSGSSYGLSASAVSGASYRDQSVQSGTTYYYVVAAVDNQGVESSYSNEVKAIIP